MKERVREREREREKGGEQTKATKRNFIPREISWSIQIVEQAVLYTLLL